MLLCVGGKKQYTQSIVLLSGSFVLISQLGQGGLTSWTLLQFCMFFIAINSTGFIYLISSLGLMQHFTVILYYVTFIFLDFLNQQIDGSSLNFWKHNLPFLISAPSLKTSQFPKGRGAKRACNPCYINLFSFVAQKAMSCFQQLRKINSHLSSVNTCNW